MSQISIPSGSESPLRRRFFRSQHSPTKSPTGLKSREQQFQDMKQLFEPQKLIADELLKDINNSVKEIIGVVDNFKETIGSELPTKANLRKLISDQYIFFQKSPSNAQITEKTKLRNGFLFEARTHKPYQNQLTTKINVMNQALSPLPLARHKTKKAETQSIDEKKKIIHEIQKKIENRHEDEFKIKEELKLKALIKHQNEQQQNQLSLEKIASTREKFFSELTSQNTEEKYKNIQQISEVFIPGLIQEYQKSQRQNQKILLRNELLSKKSQFNSYYQLVALNKNQKRHVSHQLTGEIMSFSRFQEAWNAKNYKGIESQVRKLIYAGAKVKQNLIKLPS